MSTDRVANVVVGGDRAVTCCRANHVALEYVPGVVVFDLAGSDAAFAVPIVCQRSAATQASALFRSHSCEQSELFKTDMKTLLNCRKENKIAVNMTYAKHTLTFEFF
jgi:hypothetical protein